MEEKETTFIILEGAKLIYKDENGEQSPPLLVTIVNHNTRYQSFLQKQAFQNKLATTYSSSMLLPYNKKD